MKKSAYISDVIFTFFTAFLPTVCFFRFLGLPLVLAFIIATVCGVLCSIAVGALLFHKRKQFFLKKTEEECKEKLLFHLALLSDRQKTDYFLRVFSDEQAKQWGKLRIHTPTHCYFIQCNISPVTADCLLSFSRIKTEKEKVVLCAEMDETARSFCNRLHIQVKTANEVYLLCKEKNALPEKFLGDESPNPSKRKIRLWFAKRNSKQFFFSSCILILIPAFKAS